MTDRHFFNTGHADIVVRSLKGLVATHPHLNVIPSLKVVYHANHDPSKVALLCGGGSGHEPGTVGFVGKGLLSASVAGDVFASPSAKQVIGGIQAVPSDKGTILIITNYTGDNLHFGLARLMAHGQGLKNVELVVVGDDVSVPRSRGNMVGRRCLAGITLVCKILGAGSEDDMGFQELVDLGRSTSTNTGSICMALNHCHIAGRGESDWEIPKGRCEVGLGLHNETGVFNIAQPSGEELIKQMLDLILKQDDPERSFVKYKPDDELVLLVNNQGGLSNLEMGAIVHETLNQLEERGFQPPKRIFQGCFMGSMNMPGVSLSLTNLTNISADTGIATTRLLELIDAPHTSFAWPATQNIYPLPKKLEGRKRQDGFTEVAHEEKKEAPAGPKLNSSASTFQKAMKQAANDIIEIEPKLTEWDTVLGDGDCGETVKQGAEGVLEAMKKLQLGADGDLVHFFRQLTEVIDDSMGGTLGAILSIFLAGMTTAIIDAAAASPQPTINPQFFGKVCLQGLETLKQRTAARVGHRTVMDAIIPFSEALASTGDLQKAVEACRKGTEDTAAMQAKLGRATYIGEREDRQQLPVDPGAAAFATVVEGILKAIQ